LLQYYFSNKLHRSDENYFSLLQDVVEERFRTEYLIALVVAVGLLLTIMMIVISLLVLRCKRTREKRRRRRNSFGGSSSGADNSFSGAGAEQRNGSAAASAANAASAASSAGMMRSRNGDCSSTETVDTQVRTFKTLISSEAVFLVVCDPSMNEL